MNDPVKILLEEHKLLLQAIDISKQLQKTEEDATYHHLMHDVILFLRNFSEIYHHPKEENIFYPLLKNRSANMSNEFLHEICDNHEDFKSLVAQIEGAYGDHDYKWLRMLMSKYIVLFEDHIKRENKVILSVANQLLSAKEQEEAAKAFNQLDEKYGDKPELTSLFYKIKAQAN